MSRLVLDHNAGAYSVHVPCYACGKVRQMSETVIDLDGPAFRAYFCRECAAHLWPNSNPRCDRRDCARCPR